MLKDRQLQKTPQLGRGGEGKRWEEEEEEEEEEYGRMFGRDWAEWRREGDEAAKAVAEKRKTAGCSFKTGRSGGEKELSFPRSPFYATILLSATYQSNQHPRDPVTFTTHK